MSFRLFILSLLVCSSLCAKEATKPNEQPLGKNIQPDNVYPRVKMVTNIGDIIIELDRIKAPITVDNFLSYVAANRYNNTIFHRLESDFVLQGGGYTEKYKEVETFPEIINESGNGLKNELGSVAMARYSDPHTATSQFFFNLADNEHLDPGIRWGYAVFGMITDPQPFFEKLKQIKTRYSEQLSEENMPEPTIIVSNIEILAD